MLSLFLGEAFATHFHTLWNCTLYCVILNKLKLHLTKPMSDLSLISKTKQYL